jgi:hypothetical protein
VAQEAGKICMKRIQNIKIQFRNDNIPQHDKRDLDKESKSKAGLKAMP